jgi:hypothetical protein
VHDEPESETSATTSRNAERMALIDRLLSEGAPDLAAPLDKCGMPLRLICTCCGSAKQTETRCMIRYCPACAPNVTARRMERWAAPIRTIHWPLFITLTIPNSEDPETLRKLRGHWAKFRRRKLMRDRVRGGVATFEITNKGNGWHPHLHAVADCEWLALHVPPPTRRDSPDVIRQKCDLARAELSAAWADQIKNPTAIVLAKRCHGDGIPAEILKYAVKGSDLLACIGPIAPMLRVLKATRTLSGWGSLHPLPSPDADETPLAECPDCHATKSFLPADVVNRLIRS